MYGVLKTTYGGYERSRDTNTLMLEWCGSRVRIKDPHKLEDHIDSYIMIGEEMLHIGLENYDCNTKKILT